MKRQENVAAPCNEHKTLGIRGQFNHSIHSLALFASTTSQLHWFLRHFRAVFSSKSVNSRSLSYPEFGQTSTVSWVGACSVVMLSNGTIWANSPHNTMQRFKSTYFFALLLSCIAKSVRASWKLRCPNNCMHFQYASQYLRRSSCTAWFSSLLFSSDTNAEFHLGGLWPNCELSYVTFFAESTSKAFRARSRSTCGFNQFDHGIVQTTRSQMAGDVSNKHRRNPMSSNQCQTYVNFRISMRMRDAWFETCLHSQTIFSWEVDQRRMREVVPGIQWIWVEITLACQTPSSFSSPRRLSPQFAVPTLFSSCIWNKPLLRRQFFFDNSDNFRGFFSNTERADCKASDRPIFAAKLSASSVTSMKKIRVISMPLVDSSESLITW